MQKPPSNQQSATIPLTYPLTDAAAKVIRTPSPIPSSERSPVRRYRSPSPYGRRSPSQSHPPRRGKLDHDFILGMELFKASGVLIDRGRSELTLDDVEVTSGGDCFLTLRLCVMKDCRLPDIFDKENSSIKSL
ncbi:hypothetical protein TNCV_2197911 [Trichonephila clavipes]|nr:hypothetical protein TNCV_2197911 [Trichonephila clavipes]